MRLRRLIPTTLAIATGVVALAAPAAAHVTVNPREGERGGFTKLTFRVPNEHDTASTISIEVNFPTDHVIESARTRPVPGWRARIDKTSTAVTKITWSGGVIRPGEFEEFDVSLRLPQEGDAITFPSVQTYDNGEVVRWIEDTPAGGEEPEHPAPSLTLTAGDDGGGDGHGSETGDDTGDDTTDTTAADGAGTTGAGDDSEDDDGDDGEDSDTLPIVAIAVSLVAVVLSVTSLVRRR